jgi:hypothetical protein
MQTPWVAPETIEQKPPQQSRSRAQTSPGWMQNDEPSAHFPPVQSPEQQPPAPPSVDVHGFPAVRQAVLRGWHFPPVQVPLQQADELVQVALSAVQLLALAQTPRVVSHCRLQQSVFTAQELSAPLQLVTDDAHVFETGSHDCEQHSVLDVQAAATTVQITPTPPVSPAPPAPPVPPEPVLIALTELLPQPGSATSAPATATSIAPEKTAVDVSLTER